MSDFTLQVQPRPQRITVETNARMRAVIGVPRLRAVLARTGRKGDKGDKGDTGEVPLHVGPTPPADTSLIWVRTASTS